MNKASKSPLRYKWLLLFGILTLVIIAFPAINMGNLLLMTPAPTFQTIAPSDPTAPLVIEVPTSLPVTSAPITQISSPFDPAIYGIPDEIAGYKVLAALTSENLVCFQEDQRRLVLQAPEQNMNDLIENSDQQAIDQELSKLDDDWSISIVGIGIDREQVWSQNEKWNLHAIKNGCAILGPDGPIVTPTA
jgi:hypothetical protein